MWEHRSKLGKPFDRLHRWVGRQKSAVAAELRPATHELCRQWSRQPKPAAQETEPEQRSVRMKAIQALAQGLNGVHGGSRSPGLETPGLESPGLPPSTTAAEIEAALFGRFGGLTLEYRQHARMIRSNLVTNPTLRSRVLSGDVSATELVAMNSDTLAPEEVQEARKAQWDHSLKELIVKNPKANPPRDGNGKPEFDIIVTRSTSSSSLPTVEHVQPMPGPVGIAPMDPPPTPFRMEPVPTPFRDHGGETPFHETEQTPDMFATPAHCEDGEYVALIRYLSQPVLVSGE